MMYVSFAVSGVITIPVDTKNPSKAEWKARNEFKSSIEASLSPDMLGVTYEVIRVEDESGNVATDY